MKTRIQEISQSDSRGRTTHPKQRTKRKNIAANKTNRHVRSETNKHDTRASKKTQKSATTGPTAARLRKLKSSVRETVSSISVVSSQYPGFDSGNYPGDEVMDSWFGNPYVFTGYYLSSPCHVDDQYGGKWKSWMGHWKTLKQIGWGFLILYVGQQAKKCSANVLTRAQGLTDAAAKGDELTQNAIIFLDIEVMNPLTAAMIDYARGWIAGILQDGSYKPGIYCSYTNADDLFNAAQQEYAQQGEPGGQPAFWVVRVNPNLDPPFNVALSSPSDLANYDPDSYRLR